MTNKKDNIRAIVAKEVASKHGLGTNQFYKVARGDSENDAMMADAFDLEEALKVTIEAFQNNSLLSAVKQLIPFD